MKRIIPLVFVICLVCAQGVFAEEIIEVEIESEPVNQSVEVGKHAVYSINVTNRMDNPDSFVVKFYGSRTEWRWPTNVELELDPMESKTVTAEFIPQLSGEYKYDVMVLSETNRNINSSTTIYLNSIIPPPVKINNLTAILNNGSLDTSLDVRTRESTTLDIQYVIRDSDGRVFKSESLSSEVEGEDVIVKSISLEGARAGKNTLRVSVGDGSAEQEFNLEAVHNVQKEEERTSGFGYEEISILVTNNGNVVEKGYVVKKGIAKGDFVTAFLTEPSSCLDSADSKTCTFIIDEIQPGATARVTYRIDYWPSYSKIIAAIIILILGGVYYYFRISKPKISKRIVRKGKNNYHVLLEIKAPKIRKLKNVIVRDWVSPLAKVAKEEFKHAKPAAIKKSDAGTELIWQLGKMAKKEERILSYKINTLVEGTLKMPRAYLRFKDDEGGRTRVYSQSVMV